VRQNPLIQPRIAGTIEQLVVVRNLAGIGDAGIIGHVGLGRDPVVTVIADRPRRQHRRAVRLVLGIGRQPPQHVRCPRRAQHSAGQHSLEIAVGRVAIGLDMANRSCLCGIGFIRLG
jgi:hypothetical protein